MADIPTQIIKQEVMNKTFRPNSMCIKYGKTATESLKLYHDDYADLVSQLEELDRDGEVIQKLI